MGGNENRLLLVPVVLALGLALTIAWLAGPSATPVARAQPGTDAIRVATSGQDNPGCGSELSPCLSVQHAVDAALPGDEIRVASGTYTGVNTYGGLRQVVYLSKTVTLRGGYTTTNWTSPDPMGHATTLDAEGLGRVLYITGPVTVTIEGLRITGGDATGLGGERDWDHDAGAGVFGCRATINLSDCQVYSNTASTAGSGYGGGLYLNGTEAILVATDISSNTAATARVRMGYGGGLCADAGVLTLQEGTLYGNRGSTDGDGRGGGVYCDLADITLSDSTIIHNAASTGQDWWGRGGALYLMGGSATLSGNAILSNTGNAANRGDGGGLYLLGVGTNLIGNRIAGNTAGGSSGSSAGGLLLYTCNQPTLRDNLILSNTAAVFGGGSGGGAKLQSSPSATLVGNTVRGNVASVGNVGDGGGLDLQASDQATLIGNVIFSNTATLDPNEIGRGGGLHASQSSDFRLVNNVIAGNHATTEGSGMRINGYSWDAGGGSLLHNTIADNRGCGQGVYLAGYTTLTFTNTIIAGHGSVGIQVSEGSTATLQATLWHANGANTGGAGAILSATNLYSAPVFVDPVDWDYHLAPGSGAIDAGTDAGVSGDIDGQPRPMILGFDLGADEAPYLVYLPLMLRAYEP